MGSGPPPPYPPPPARVAFPAPSGPTPDVHLRVPGSKSESNRALLLAAWAAGHSRLDNWLQAGDTLACLAAVRVAGARVVVRGPTCWVAGLAGRPRPRRVGGAPVVVDLGDSGTLARFLAPLWAASPSAGLATLAPSRQLAGRPMGPLMRALDALGADVAAAAPDGRLPWRVAGRALAGGCVAVDGALSSQFASGLMMMGPLCRGPLHLEVSPPPAQIAYLHLTARLLSAFGARLRGDPAAGGYRLRPGGLRGADVALAADASTAAYFFALAAATGGALTVRDMPPPGQQPDDGILAVLARMGARVDRRGGGVRVRGPARLRGGFTCDVGPMADQLPTLAALASLADRPVRLVGAAHARHHETDRIAQMAAGLARVGAGVEVHGDGLTVRPPPAWRGGRLDASGDHRLAMAWAVVGAARGRVEISGCGAVTKTCPTFFDLLAAAGGRFVVLGADGKKSTRARP